MPSPFPGMDPYLEGPEWPGFHSDLISAFRALLVPRVRPEYVVDIERYVFIETSDTEPVKNAAPDVYVAETGLGWKEYAGSAVATLTPVRNSVALPDLKGQPYLVIRTHRGHRVVTIIELLSPTNKESSRGQPEYLRKRLQYMRSDVSLVEIDLLRGGLRLPTEQPLQPGDYYAYVSPPLSVGQVDVYAWYLQDSLPTVPIPLAKTDRPVPLDLQAAFTTVYDRGGYDYALAYDQPLDPPLSPPDDTWAREIVSKLNPRAAETP